MSQFAQQAIRFVIGVILARLLAPEQFGLIGMVFVFTGFAGLFSELGLGAALVQRPDLDEDHLTAAFWLNVVAGVTLTALLAAFAPLIARFYGQPRLVPIARALSLQFAIGSLGTVQIARFTRSMQFRTLTLMETATAVLSGALGIALALDGFGVWSLVAQSLSASVITVAWLWLASEWRPGSRVHGAKLRQLLGFGSGLMGFNVFNYWVRNGDNALIGRVIGSEALGIYSRAYSLMLLPLSQISGVVGRVMFPALSAIQLETARVKAVYLRAISAIALVTFPMMFGLLVVAEHFVLALLGPKWAGVIPVLRVFALLGMVQSIGTTVGWIYQAEGRTGLMFKWGVASGIVVISAFVIGLHWGMMGVAVGYGIASGGILLYPSFAIPGRLIDLRFGEIVRTLAPTLACASMMALVVWGTDSLLWGHYAHGIALTLDIALGLSVYTLLIHVFRISAYRDVRGILETRLRHRVVQNAEVAW